MKRRTWAIVAAVLLLLVIGSQLYAGTSSNGNPYILGDEQNQYDGAAQSRPEAATAAPAALQLSQEAGAAGGAQDLADAPNAAPAGDRLVIKTANVEAEIEYIQLDQANRRIEQMVTRLGGYIVANDDSTSNISSNAYTTITFRVPAAKFEEALRSVEGDSIKILRREISGQDVTEEYTDIASQLRNLEATAARLRTLLEKAETVTEAVEVTRTLSQYEGEIEVLKGRQKYLAESAAMSLITLTIRGIDVPAAYFVAPAFNFSFGNGWSPARTAAAAWDDVVALGRDVADLLIALAIWAPIWLPLALCGWFGWRVVRRIIRRSAKPTISAAPIATNE